MTFSLREMILVVLFCGAVLGWCCAVYKTDQNIAAKEFEFKQELATEKQKHIDYVTEKENADRVKQAGFYVLSLDYWHTMNPDGSISFYVQDSRNRSNVRVELASHKPTRIYNDAQLGVDKFYPQIELDKQKAEEEARKQAEADDEKTLIKNHKEKLSTDQ